MATGWQKRGAASAKELGDIVTEVRLRNAIWDRNIDQMTTKEVADRFRISQRKALRLLKEIASGKSRDKRFVYDEERQGVIVSDGSIFTYGPADIEGGSYTSKKSVKHYIWFCS